MFLELSLISLAVLVLLVAVLLVCFSPSAKTRKCAASIPGPPPYPFIGNLHEVKFGSEGVETYMEMREKYGNVLRYWLGYKLVVLLSDPDDAEILFRDMQNINKSHVYEFIHPWLGTGLLTSSGQKWHMRRKAITPTFHFKVLEQFIEVFDRKSRTLIQCLEEQLEKPCFDVSPYISRCSLDVICETAMGVSVNAQTDLTSPFVTVTRTSGSLEYLICDLISDRFTTPWLHSPLLWNLLGYRRREKKAISVLHGFTNKVIAEQEKQLTTETLDKNTEEENGYKKKTAFLELLLRMKAKGGSSFLTHADVREEVDTFMFEGHDTTSSAISFALYELSRNPDVQKAAYEEVRDILGSGEDALTIEALHQMKYLEMVIKETIRLYPSVPIVAREISKDLQLASGHIVPVGSIVIVVIGGVHTNKDHFPDPFRFDPDRFLPEAMVKRHPYAFVPFSAGPRNCIGQKFAMLEMKATLSRVLLSYELLPGDVDARPSNDLTLQSSTGHKIRLRSRSPPS